MEKRNNRRKQVGERIVALFLAVIFISTKFLPVLSALPWKVNAAEIGDTILAYGSGFHHYCIDGTGANRALIDGDEYVYILPSETLNREETAIVFWGMLTLQASFGTVPQINAVIQKINAQAAAVGLVPISKLVTEADLKLLLHSASVRAKYPWLQAVLANEERYLQLAGLLSAGGAGNNPAGNAMVPSVLQGHTQLGNPYLLTAKDQETSGQFWFAFDPSGADVDFIRSVPLLFSTSGAPGTFSSQLPEGWVCQKSDTEILLSSTANTQSTLYLMFDTQGTRYASGEGGFSSPEEVYEQCLQIWRCSRCAGTHRQMYNGTAPLSAHQRLAFVELEVPNVCYYAAVGASGKTGVSGGGLAFTIYRHEEDWTSTYNVRLRKYDHETGKPLEDAVFSLYERFDDQEKVREDRDGAAVIYAGGAPYKSYHKDSPVKWEDFRFVSALVSDEKGEAKKTIEHGYHYDKTFCDGHPAPVFVSVPEEEEDEETGEIENQDEIEAAQEENRRLALLWLDTQAACDTWASGAFAGVHFHWLMPEVEEGEIQKIASVGGEPGETPSAGTTDSADGARAFSDSGCEDDTGETYENFISLKYSYAIAEDTAREGYTLHGNHSDDIPIEVITTDASEHGANAHFAGIYSHEIRIQDEIVAKPAQEVVQVRNEGKTGIMRQEVPNVKQERLPFLQRLLQIFFPVPAEEEFLIDDRAETAQTASGSNAKKASDSNLEAHTRANTKAVRASVSDLDDFEEETGKQVKLQLHFPDNKVVTETYHRVQTEEMGEESSSDLFSDAYNRALHGESSGEEQTLGPSDRYSHCSNRDQEDDWWEIYDHRTEGEIHINKRDLDLKAGESETYDSYGESQGDGVLEGAVYGLFAAEDLVHPDGKTGIVYRKNDLTAVATTDKHGDASFLVYTEAPGKTYRYEHGQIENQSGTWNERAPSNLYCEKKSFDDYTEDGQYTREYPDYQTSNGNCWIGRPLLMGNYYVKELSRSEGYELSVGNRKHPVTNAGQDLNCGAQESSREGYVSVTRNLFAEQQVRLGATGEYKDPGFRELFFTVESQKSEGFDLVFQGLLPGAKLYRLDTAQLKEPVKVGTGNWIETVQTDAYGNPVYAVTEYEGQYPKYDAEGALLTRERPVNAQVRSVEVVARKTLEEARCEALLAQAEEGLDETAVMEKLMAPFIIEEKDFVKYKLERILRAHGKGTPKRASESGNRYSTLEEPVYDTGYRSGEEIHYGAPVCDLILPKVQEDGSVLTTGDLLAALLDYYQTNSQYSYGGIDRIEETEEGFLVTVYAGRTGNPEYFFAPETEQQSAAFYRRVSYVPEDEKELPRYLYAVYTQEEEENSFGSYTDFSVDVQTEGVNRRVSAVLLPDAMADANGALVTRCMTETVYYEPGEIPLDADGNRIVQTRYEEETVDGETWKEYGHWSELPWNQDGMAHVESNYIDFYGNAHQDEEKTVWELKLVLPGAEQIPLKAEDLEALTGSKAGWSVGDRMGAATYYLMVNHAGVQAFLDWESSFSGNENSYVRSVELRYPGQEFVWQDGAKIPGSGTRQDPVLVEERSIRQRILVGKTIETTSYRNTDSYARVHEDRWTRQYDQAKTMENFRFKAYLKFNLQNLYRNEAGEIIWQDRDGKERTYKEQKQANERFPDKVNRIYTKVQHRTAPLFKNSEDAVICNEALYSFADGQILDTANAGYTALLETTEVLVEDGTDTRWVKRLNYEKFFAAMETANHDKWDDASPEYTSYRPVGNVANRSEDTLWNLQVSDGVRQFAIDWYLDDEIAKLAKGVDAEEETSFTDERLDRGLRRAIEKAQNYLKPFFAYDLDTIYAIEWDETDGGTDKDRTTLSSDQKPEEGSDTGYYGVSASLPYGTYVIAEQQPRYANLEDFKNRHYEIDQPKEVMIPTKYLDEEGALASPGKMDPYYTYQASYTAAELESRYQIRFLEESHKIFAHSARGDFEVYKYGMEVDHLQNGVPEQVSEGDYFALTQSEYRPTRNDYNDQDDRSNGEVTYYLTEGLSGRNAVAEVYRYSSVSEQALIADDVGYSGGTVTEDNAAGIFYRDQVAAMQGQQTAYDGRYAPMLYPYTVEAEADASYLPYACVWFRNRFFTSRLRIEKLDSETHENLLHDGAIFQIYAAKREDSPDGEGRVQFYETDTQIQGTKAFLTAMGASEIRPVLRSGRWNPLKSYFAKEAQSMDELYTGIVPAGTPICEESERIVLGDRFGLQQGAMKAFTTVCDKKLEDGSYALQTVGYLHTPQPLAAGAYVLCEWKAPAGYVRTKPVALELYSDQITYYQNGNQDSRVLAAIYEDLAPEQTAHGTKPPDKIHTARVYIENEPIRLQVEKKTVPDEQGNVRSVVGAKMTLFDAICLNPSGDSQDFSYEGLVVERDDAGQVNRMYVKEGFGGEKTEFLPERDENGELITTILPSGVDQHGEVILTEGNSWNAVTVKRPDTDILYYDLDGLRIQIIPKTDGRDGAYEAFAWKGAAKFLEFIGGDLSKISYDEKDKVLHVERGTQIYHLGREGQRDALVDPYTGMAYVIADFNGSNGSWDQIRGQAGSGAGKKQVFVWPVNIRRDVYGNIIARDKITTSRMALVGSGENAWLTGSWKSKTGEESHRKISEHQNEEHQNLNGEVLQDENNGTLEKTMKPVYDRHGLAVFYRKSEAAYDKATDLYDRNGEFVRGQDSDNLEAYNYAAYAVQEHTTLHEEKAPLSHRLGEAYVMENTWVTSEQAPNDPFVHAMTEKTGDILERVPVGHYIMEELQAPDGLIRALPMGVTVQETTTLQSITMVDELTRTEFSKRDGTEDGEKSAFDCGYIEGSVLGLWKSENEDTPVVIWTSDDKPYMIQELPVGSYLWKEIETPSGFVSHAPMPILVSERAEVQPYEMWDDHTRIEVEKYCLENGKDLAEGKMPVANAGFTLFPAKLDAENQVCYSEGKPQYDATTPLATWTTDDGTTYQNFPLAFEKMYEEYGAQPGSRVMWDSPSGLHKAEFEAAYQKEAKEEDPTKQQIFVYRTETGERIRIGVTEENDAQVDQTLKFEYQFNWQKLSDINAYACTYLTLENRQRLDYLPVGQSYVLVETAVPPGFSQAKEVLIEVKDTGEIQQYQVENEEGTLLISKVYADGARELAGAHLALYRANEEGGLTRSPEYLFDSWISGRDGSYTELDAINGRIPEGYASGDLKPHRIRKLPDGMYWLVERASPAYYTTFQPVQILYEWQPQIRVVRVSDRLVTGTLDLRKTDSKGNLLEGAVFELTAYEEGKPVLNVPEQLETTRQEVFRMRLTAPVQKTDLPVGSVGEDGSIRPFWYELKEVEAPKGYVLNPEVYRWQFQPNTGVGSYFGEASPFYQITVVDRKEPEPTPPTPSEPEPEKPTPEEPKKPEPKPPTPSTPPNDHVPDEPKTPPAFRLGKILAWYRSASPEGASWLYLGPDGRWKLRLPHTGDERKTAGLVIVCLLSGVGVVICKRKLEHKEKQT